MQEIKRGIEAYRTVSGRMEKSEYKGAVIMNDCYNASPASMAASLRVLAQGSGRRLALLGDMLELGERTVELHEGVGRLAAELGVDMLVAVGSLGAHIAKAAKEAGLEKAFALSRDEAVELIKNELREGDTLLVKASRGMKLEQLIARITE